MPRFFRDWESGTSLGAVARDCEEAMTRKRVRSVPPIIVDGGRRLRELADVPTYHQAIGEG